MIQNGGIGFPSVWYGCIIQYLWLSLIYVFLGMIFYHSNWSNWLLSSYCSYINMDSMLLLSEVLFADFSLDSLYSVLVWYFCSIWQNGCFWHVLHSLPHAEHLLCPPQKKHRTFCSVSTCMYIYFVYVIHCWCNYFECLDPFSIFVAWLWCM